MRIKHKIFFDGATLYKNPSEKIGYGVLYNNEEHIGSYYSSAGNLTNNLSEYYGFLLSLRLVEMKKPEGSILISCDSKLVVKQMNGEWRIKDGGYAKVARGCLKLFNKLKKKYEIKLVWIPREQNDIADRLSKEALIK